MRRRNRQRGASLVEYSLGLALIALVALAAIPNMSTGIRKTVCSVMQYGINDNWWWNSTTKKCENTLLMDDDPANAIF